MKTGILLIGVCLVVLNSGCDKPPRTVADFVVEDIANCHKLVIDEQMAAPANIRYALFKKTFDEIATIPDSGLKIKRAKELASLVESVDLKLSGTDYSGFVDRVSRYKTLLDWSIWTLFEVNAEGEYTLQCLMNGMNKYRTACFSILAVRVSDESPEMYSRKQWAITSLASEYRYAMMSLNKAEFGYLQSLPKELHGKYHEWKKTLSRGWRGAMGLGGVAL